MNYFTNVAVMGGFVPLRYQPPRAKQPTTLELCDRCGRHVSRVGDRRLRRHQDNQGYICANTIPVGEHHIPPALLAELRAGNLPPIVGRG